MTDRDRAYIAHLEAVVEAARDQGIIDSGFTGEHDPEAMHKLRDAIAALDAFCEGREGK